MKSFDDGAFGALTWLMVLSERLPTQQALTAVDGWGGDLLSLELVKGGMDVKVARCGADRLVREFTLAQLNNPHLDQGQVLRTIQPCRQEA